MKIRFIAIYKLEGANKLPDGVESVGLLALQSPLITATLTINPEPYYLHIDRSFALGTLILKAIFTPNKEGTLEGHLATEIKNVQERRAKLKGTDVFLVFEGEMDHPVPEFDTSYWGNDDFAVCLEAIDKGIVRAQFRQVVEQALVALSVSLPANADRAFGKIGDVIYIVGPNNEKPIYTFNIKGGDVRLSVASPLNQNVIDETAMFAQKLANERAISLLARLLANSLDLATADLQSFLDIWSAFEIFVNATFRTTYGMRWRQIMENGAPTSAQPVFKRIKDVMHDKYRVADKFIIIASILDADAADNDSTKFRKVKEFRDKLFHSGDIPTSPLPTGDIQKLLIKYLKLHLGQ